MKDEIKEAIDNLNGIVKGIYRMDEAGLEIENIKIILDYITNLQEENRLLKMNMLEKQFPDLNAVEVEIDTYKSRNEKAIEYIKKVIEENEEWTMYREDTLLNILQGDDKDE